tara:strand:- start:88462 stop:88878 length:417 start_codon:yes stop_codon:yes gene_type:complete
MKRKLKTFISSSINLKLKFGDYILFQEYTSNNNNNNNNNFNVSKPILAIYLGMFVADQTIGFNYVKWNNDNHTVYITNEHVTNYPTVKEVEKVESHIEWSDYIDILGVWENRPGWKQILSKYRNQNTDMSVDKEDIDS